MSDPYAGTDEWPTPSLPVRPVFDRADNTARLALEVASLKRENAALRAEVERLHSWDGLLSLLDEHWPEDIFPTTADDDRRDTGPRLIAAIRHAKAAEDRLRKVAELADEWDDEDAGNLPTGDRSAELRGVLAAPPAAPEAAEARSAWEQAETLRREGADPTLAFCPGCGHIVETNHTHAECASPGYGRPAPVSSGEAATGEACCMAGTPLASPGVTHEVGCTRPAPVVAPSAEEPAEGGA